MIGTLALLLIGTRPSFAEFVSGALDGLLPSQWAISGSRFENGKVRYFDVTATRRGGGLKKVYIDACAAGSAEEGNAYMESLRHSRQAATWDLDKPHSPVTNGEIVRRDGRGVVVDACTIGTYVLTQKDERDLAALARSTVAAIDRIESGNCGSPRSLASRCVRVPTDPGVELASFRSTASRTRTGLLAGRPAGHGGPSGEAVDVTNYMLEFKGSGPSEAYVGISVFPNEQVAKSVALERAAFCGAGRGVGHVERESMTGRKMLQGLRNQGLFIDRYRNVLVILNFTLNHIRAENDPRAQQVTERYLRVFGWTHWG
jgi:hypothetical protein